MRKSIKKMYLKMKISLKKFWYRNKFKIFIYLLIFAFFVVYFWNNIFISIQSGESGVMWYRFMDGTVMDKVYGEGLHIIFPWDKLIVYSIRTQERHDSIKILSSAGLYIDMDISYRFHPERYKYLPHLHRTWGPQYIERFVQPEAKAAAIAVLGERSPKELFSLSTTQIQEEIESLLDKEFDKSFIILDDFLITRLALPKTISDAIERKLTQEQLLQEYGYKVQVEQMEKKRKEIEALGINLFEQISGIPILKWRGLSVTSEIARSNNTKVIIVGTGPEGLPVILNADK